MYTGGFFSYRVRCTYTYEGGPNMIRTTLAALGIAATAVITAPTGTAAPTFCAPHDAGSIYIHACASGSGGGTAAWDAAQYHMKRLGITQADLDRHRAAQQHP
jgi:hypothetical protein